MPDADLGIISGSLQTKEEAAATFFRRHRETMLLIGALLIFLSFIVREGLREELKDFVEDVNQAQSLFVMEEESLRLSQRLDNVFRINEATYDKLTEVMAGNTPAPLGISVSTVGEKWQSAFDTLHRLDIGLAAARRLLKSVPHSKPFDVELNELKCRFDEESQAYRAYVPVGSGASFDQVWASFKEIDNIEHDSYRVEDDLQSMAASVLDNSIRTKESYECYLKISTWSSYILFVLVSALALIGKVYGAETLNDGD